MDGIKTMLSGAFVHYTGLPPGVTAQAPEVHIVRASEWRSAVEKIGTSHIWWRRRKGDHKDCVAQHLAAQHPAMDAAVQCVEDDEDGKVDDEGDVTHSVQKTSDYAVRSIVPCGNVYVYAPSTRLQCSVFIKNDVEHFFSVPFHTVEIDNPTAKSRFITLALATPPERDVVPAPTGNDAFSVCMRHAVLPPKDHSWIAVNPSDWRALSGPMGSDLIAGAPDFYPLTNMAADTVLASPNSVGAYAGASPVGCNAAVATLIGSVTGPLDKAVQVSVHPRSCSSLAFQAHVKVGSTPPAYLSTWCFGMV